MQHYTSHRVEYRSRDPKPTLIKNQSARAAPEIERLCEVPNKGLIATASQKPGGGELACESEESVKRTHLKQVYSAARTDCV